MVLRRQMRDRVRLPDPNRLFPGPALPLVSVNSAGPRLEAVVRSPCAGFRSCWCWQSRSGRQRPQVSAELRALIRRMNIDRPFRGRRESMANCSSWELRSRAQVRIGELHRRPSSVDFIITAPEFQFSVQAGHGFRNKRQRVIVIEHGILRRQSRRPPCHCLDRAGRRIHHSAV